MAEAILLAAAEEQRLIRLQRIERRFLRERSSPMTLPDTTFVGHFRLRRSEFQTLCVDLIPLLPTTQRSTAVRPEIKILAAITYYANGSYQKNVGAYSLLSLSQTTVSDCLRDVTEAINEPTILAKYIKFPRTQADRLAISRRFMEKFGFPGVVGCIDGTHVSIIRPVEFEEAYYNRKHYHSINTMLVCDADLRILHVDASVGGQSHDSHVLRNSQVKVFMEDLADAGERCWFLGDSGYAQRDWMMTPILNAAPDSPEYHYTQMHVRTRNVVERCIGVLKTRWRCLLVHRVQHYTPIKAGKMINACVVLHNLINDENIAIDEDEMRRDRARQPPREPPPQENLRIGPGRQALVERLWRSRGAAVPRNRAERRRNLRAERR